MTHELQSLGLSGPYQVHVHPHVLVVDRRAHQVFVGFDEGFHTVLRALAAYSHGLGVWQGEQGALQLAELGGWRGSPLLIVPSVEEENPGGLAGVTWLVNRLLGPGGCPWDQEQTHLSLRKHLIEEAYELIDAIDQDDPEAMREELGDVLLQPVMHAQMKYRDGSYDINEVAEQLVAKLVRRHPHVFGDSSAVDSDAVLKQWDSIKKKEKATASVLGGVPSSMPALMLAMEVSKRAARSGFEWGDLEGVWQKFDEETAELKAAIHCGNLDEARDELGDLLFTVVNLARWLKIDPEESLRTMVNRFRHRFMQMEALARKPLQELSFDEWESLWATARASQAKS